jgi:cell division protein FtsW (lipid II flippase)
VSDSKSHNDFVPAAIGFFGGLVILAVFAFTVSRMTTAKFESHSPAAGQQAH